MSLFDRLGRREASGGTELVPGVGRMPYPAYRGGEPYIFVSYAHQDSDAVFPEIRRLNELGCRVWYDEGISPGSEWTDEIAAALERCALFIVFFTPNSAESGNVQNEIDFALDEKKPCIAIHLRETTLRPGTRLRFGMKHAILRYGMTEEEYVYKLVSALERLGLGGSAAPSLGSAPAPSAASAPPPPAPEITSVGDFQVEHGFLRDYLGREPNITLPDQVVIVGSSSLGPGRRFVETVDLNRTDALLDGAFHDCPNLREIRLPRSLTSIAGRQFSNCPRLTLYCYRDSVPADFAQRFGGKAIVYLDEGTDRS